MKMLLKIKQIIYFYY